MRLARPVAIFVAKTIHITPMTSRLSFTTKCFLGLEKPLAQAQHTKKPYTPAPYVIKLQAYSTSVIHAMSISEEALPVGLLTSLEQRRTKKSSVHAPSPRLFNNGHQSRPT